MIISYNSFACECECTGDCTFKGSSSGAGFVALVKVIEYSDFLDYEIDGYNKKMPFSMTVEVIEKYIGSETRKKIKIWGDNGMLCRPYIANFEIGNYYLIAPTIITETTKSGKENDYDFFACSTDYLSVDYNKKIAFGEYTKKRNQVSLLEFEKEIKNLTFKKTNWFTNNSENQFYTSDTITLFKILNRNDNRIELNDILIKIERNGGKDISELTFKSKGKLELVDTYVESWTETVPPKKWKWKYNSKNLNLDLIDDRHFNSSYKVFSIERDNLIWGKDKENEGTKVYLLVLKLKRIKQ